MQRVVHLCGCIYFIFWPGKGQMYFLFNLTMNEFLFAILCPLAKNNKLSALIYFY